MRPAIISITLLHPPVPLFASALLLPLLLLNVLRNASCFNLDTSAPYYGYGPRGSLFGFSLAQHFKGDKATLIVGAPLAESGQPGTNQTGSIFLCPLELLGRNGVGGRGRNGHMLHCPLLQVEYPTQADFHSKPQNTMINSRPLHREGKNKQLLGFTVHSTSVKGGYAMVCAPLMRYGPTAYTQGVCYLLSTELNHTGAISTCNNLPREDRHNDYGSCEQGFSAFIDKDVILTGLPGARKWTGGVYARYEFNSGGFPDTVERWTMEVSKEQSGVTNILTSHDYLGYSVRRGRFGFWYEAEDGSNFTVVSGATRYNQTGAVVFLPFKRKSLPEEERVLGLDRDFTTLHGQQLGSGFGYTIEVLDLNADGFDDLIVGAPFEFSIDGAEREEYGGVVYVYYSSGTKQDSESGDKVFLPPVVIRARQKGRSLFGFALAKLGNVDNDAHGYQDFAVGAPQANHGQGAVYIFHGGERESLQKIPSQEIHPSELGQSSQFRGNGGGTAQIRTFGSALSGSADMDGNGYGDLAIGAPDSNTVVFLRTRPVVEVRLGSDAMGKFVKIDGGRGCPAGSRTCFDITTSINVLPRNNTAGLLNFHEEPFICSLQIIPFSKGVPARAEFVQRSKAPDTWPCGRNAVQTTQYRKHKIYVPTTNRDWTTPLKFNFTVAMRERRSLDLVPVINNEQSEQLFTISFDKKCGEDNDCHTNLVLSAVLLNMTRDEEGRYTAKVTEKDSIVVKFEVENRRERAFLSRLFVWYNSDELDFPRVLRKPRGDDSAAVDIERNNGNYTVIALGNPIEEGKKLTFDLSFKLVRSSSERISTSLNFVAAVNSSSVEDVPSDNDWQAELRLIKEADLVLKAVSSPQIVRFSRGSEKVTDEEDIGPLVVHAYTLTNLGPFYARNVSVTIDWPLRLAMGRDRWLLYPLEDPLIKHNDEIRTCKTAFGAVNPAGVFNDETLKLTYKAKMLTLRRRKERSMMGVSEDVDDDTGGDTEDSAPSDWSIFTDSRIITELAKDSAREESRIINLGAHKCGSNRHTTWEDQRQDPGGVVHCVTFVCPFNHLGNGDSALIEIRSRLWNSSLRGDYKSIEYVRLSSKGRIEADPAQGIVENNYADNFAEAETHAYPDRPYQEDHISWWMLLLAILIGLLILSLLICLCWKCGFFKRKRPSPYLHQANYHHEREQYSET